MVAKKKYKMDLWKLLSNINMKNIEYYNNLSEDEAKEFSPLVIMRWLTGCSDSRSIPARQLDFINQFVNPYVFQLGKHKDLLYKLMTVTTVGFDARYKFIKTKKRGTKFPKSTAVVKSMFNYNTKHAQDAIKILSSVEITDMAQRLGYQDAELKELKKELKNKPG